MLKRGRGRAISIFCAKISILLFNLLCRNKQVNRLSLWKTHDIAFSFMIKFLHYYADNDNAIPRVGGSV